MDLSHQSVINSPDSKSLSDRRLVHALGYHIVYGNFVIDFARQSTIACFVDFLIRVQIILTCILILEVYSICRFCIPEHSRNSPKYGHRILRYM